MSESRPSGTSNRSSNNRAAVKPQRSAKPWTLAALGLVACVGFILLGNWQIERRAWKLELISRIEQRVNAPTVIAPPMSEWPEVGRARDEYRHVTVVGRFITEWETLVEASTGLGSGFWVMTPMQLADGSIVLVNRGFITPDKRDRATRDDPVPAGPTRINGLLRMSEPKGRILRDNDAAAARWYSRDVEAIATVRGMRHVAPYFIDADADESKRDVATGRPVGGLTVINFTNTHLLYAITWYTLALMVVGAAGIIVREERRQRSASNATPPSGKASGPMVSRASSVRSERGGLVDTRN
jgi:surfeit locus 1 family protein